MTRMSRFCLLASASFTAAAIATWSVKPLVVALTLAAAAYAWRRS